MTFRKVIVANIGKTAIIVSADNDNVDQFRFRGVCRNCRGQQVSNDPDVLCLRCKDAVEYTDTHKTPVK